MPRPASPQPTAVELQILQILWKQGSSTVREVHNALRQSKQTSYATTVKMLVIMFEKGLVKRDDSRRPQVYRAASGQKQTQRRMLDAFIQKAYDGSAASLVLQALSSKSASPEDLDEIKRLVDRLKREQS